MEGVPWKKTQEGRIVYDRSPKPFRFSAVVRILKTISLQDSKVFQPILLEQFLEAQGLVSFLYARSAVTAFLGIDLPKIIADVLRLVTTGFGDVLSDFLRDPGEIQRARDRISLLEQENESLRRTLRLYEGV